MDSKLVTHHVSKIGHAFVFPPLFYGAENRIDPEIWCQNLLFSPFKKVYILEILLVNILVNKLLKVLQSLHGKTLMK